MKASTKTVILGSAALAALGMAAGAQDAHAAATGVPINATVLAPVQITSTRTLNFGSMTETGTGTMKVAVDDTGTPGGSVTSIGGTIQAGGFKLQASSGKNVTVTAPASATVNGLGEDAARTRSRAPARWAHQRNRPKGQETMNRSSDGPRR